MGSLVDSSVFIAAERGQLDLDHFTEKHGATGLALAAITVSELLHGVLRLRRSTRRLHAESFVETILARVPVVSFDVVCARTHAVLGANLARRGVTIGAHDLLIGATGIAHGLAVLTRDRRSFPKIPELEVRLC